MAWIALEGMRFHAFHGVYEAEQQIGTEYVVDIYVKSGIAKAAATDAVEQTINYEMIYRICQIEMETPRKLIETVLAAIAARMKHQFGAMQALRIRVRKLQPPLGGRVAEAWVEEDADFVASCPRCKSKLICYSDDSCWCKAEERLHPATKETLLRQFGSTCLCQNCLKLYAG
jgi:dihydroneopterin aldolase